MFVSSHPFPTFAFEPTILEASSSPACAFSRPRAGAALSCRAAASRLCMPYVTRAPYRATPALVKPSRPFFAHRVYTRIGDLKLAHRTDGGRRRHQPASLPSSGRKMRAIGGGRSLAPARVTSPTSSPSGAVHANLRVNDAAAPNRCARACAARDVSRELVDDAVACWYISAPLQRHVVLMKL